MVFVAVSGGPPSLCKGGRFPVALFAWRVCLRILYCDVAHFRWLLYSVKLEACTILRIAIGAGVASALHVPVMKRSMETTFATDESFFSRSGNSSGNGFLFVLFGFLPPLKMLLTFDVLILVFLFLFFNSIEKTKGARRVCFPVWVERWLRGSSLKCLSGLGAGVGSLVLRGSDLPHACVDCVPFCNRGAMIVFLHPTPRCPLWIGEG